MPLTLSQLVHYVGDENIKVQRLDASLTSASTNKKGVTKLTFLTEEITTNELLFGGEKARMHGLIIWLPKDLLPKGMVEKHLK